VAASITTDRVSSRGKAFTLIEVLLVVVIASIAAAIVAPAMLEAGTIRSQAASRAIIADILFAQNDGIARRAERRVVFDLAGNNYAICDAAGAMLPAAWHSGSLNQVKFATDQRFQGVKLDSADFGGSATLVFDAMGSPLSGGTVELSAGSTHYRIRVAAFTGRVTIEQVTTGG